MLPWRPAREAERLLCRIVAGSSGRDALNEA
jgi:hypothetical protein